MRRIVLYLAIVIFACLQTNAQIKVNSDGEVGIGGEPRSGYSFSIVAGKKAYISSRLYINPNDEYNPMVFSYDSEDEFTIFRPLYNNDGRIGTSTHQFNRIYGYRIYQNGSQVTSDERLKENIVTVESAIDKINQLRPVTFDFKIDESILNIKDDTKRESEIALNKDRIGFIAQEVQEVLPGLVEYDKEADMYSMSYIEIIPLLTSAIQEQQKQITTLQQTLAEHDKEIQVLKEQVLKQLTEK